MKEMLFEELVEIFEEFVVLSDVQISVNSVLGEDIPVDSREMLRILSRIESLRQFSFDPNEVIFFKTMADLLEDINKHKEED
jgi:acyl carrier protein